MRTPTENEIQVLTDFLLGLPFRMRNLGHKTIPGHSMYVQGCPVVKATLCWLARQNDETWDYLIEAWGGEEVVLDIQRDIMKKQTPSMRDAIYSDWNKEKENE